MGLKELDFHLTNRCALGCGHCVFTSGERAIPEMDFEKVSNVVDQFATESEHKGMINIFGGEVLQRRDIMDIIRKIRREGLSIGITTNCHVPAQIIEDILQQDIQRITADLDGSTAQVHKALRNREGNFEAVIDVLRRSVERNIFTTVNSVLHTENMHQVEEILELAREIGVHGLAFYYLTPTGRGVNIANQCIDAENWMLLKERVEDWVEQNDPTFTVCWEEAYEAADKPHTETPWRCKKEHTETVFIRCDGKVYSCALLEGSSASMGNMNADTLSVILSRREEKAFTCSDGCPALAFHATRDVTSKDPRPHPDNIRLGCPYDYQILNAK